VRRAEDLVVRTERLAEGLIPPVEAQRSQAELARRQQAELLARERWRVSSAELSRVLRFAYGGEVEPVEPPNLLVEMLSIDGTVDGLIPVGLTNRPELASQQRLVQATLQLLRQERMRPLMPSVLLRGASTPVTGTLGAGIFGGGTNGYLGSFQGREDIDLQVLWQLDNLGFGNRARVQQRRAENQAAIVEVFRTQDRIAAEISQAYAQAQLAAKRVTVAERGLTFAATSAEMNLAGIGQTRRQGEMVILVIRPQEAVASIQALAQAYVDYYGAINDANRAQFRLYRALGKPSSLLLPSAPAMCPQSPFEQSVEQPVRLPPASGDESP
jgi:outer membrane protein TolC